eukprot:3931149-Karenia_brevis.AAC.1
MTWMLFPKRNWAGASSSGKACTRSSVGASSSGDGVLVILRELLAPLRSGLVILHELLAPWRSEPIVLREPLAGMAIQYIALLRCRDTDD